jgi:MraZ protein
MALDGQTFAGIILYPSFVHDALDGAGIDLLEKLAASVDQFDPFTDQHDAFATTIFGDSVQLPFDAEGRVNLPENLLAHAGITEQAAFLGRGGTFQVWEPAALTQYKKEALEKARADRAALRRHPSPESSE